MRIAVLLAVGLAVTASLVHAQSDDDDDDMDYYPLVPTGRSLRYGLRYVGGPKIAFKNVGAVPVNIAIVDPTSLSGHGYNDGYVNPDARTDSNGRPLNDGLTNTWQVNYASQITSDGNIAEHLYSTSSVGTALNGKSLSAAGWELQAGRSLGKIARKVDISLVAGISFSSINGKTDATIPAQLTTLTDVYSLNGQGAPSTLPYSAPTTPAYISLVDVNGNPVLGPDGTPQTQAVATSLLLGRQPISRTTTTGATTVKGHWQVKGAYYTFRVGPMIQIPITERLKVSFGTGAALSYVGSDYIVDEEIELDEVVTPVQTAELDHRNLVLPAFYADLDAEYWLTERSGFYVGATYQRSKSFEQTLGGRTATIDLGTASGVTTGLTLRF